MLCQAPKPFSAGGQHARHSPQNGAGTPRYPPLHRRCQVLAPDALAHLLQRRVTQQQALLFRAEANLRHGLIAATLNGEHAALTELGVAHGIADRQGRDFLALVHAGTVRHLRRGSRRQPVACRAVNIRGGRLRTACGAGLVGVIGAS